MRNDGSISEMMSVGVDETGNNRFSRHIDQVVRLRYVTVPDTSNSAPRDHDRPLLNHLAIVDCDHPTAGEGNRSLWNVARHRQVNLHSVGFSRIDMVSEMAVSARELQSVVIQPAWRESSLGTHQCGFVQIDLRGTSCPSAPWHSRQIQVLPGRMGQPFSVRRGDDFLGIVKRQLFAGIFPVRVHRQERHPALDVGQSLLQGPLFSTSSIGPPGREENPSFWTESASGARSA